MSKSKISIVAIITARGGSKRFPGKNLAKIDGRSLISYTIQAAVDCPDINETWVTTDSEDIALEATACGARLINRPAKLSQDSSTSYDAVVHALETLEQQGRTFDYFMLLQPTSPLRNSSHITEAIEALSDNQDAKSVFSVCEIEHSPYKALIQHGDFVKPLFAADTLNLPAQQLPKVLRQNGAMYLIPVHEFLHDTKHFFVEPVIPYFMDGPSSVDVDTETDLWLAEYLLATKKDKSGREIKPK